MSTTIRNEKLFCENCGQEFPLKFPLAITEMNKKIKAFDTLHKDCEKTWVEPEADQSKDIEEKANWWITNGRVGMSSKTMWSCFMGVKDFKVNHPYDPDDFSRCYKLLEAVPEWKSPQYMQRLKRLSTAWSNLVDNWDKLTEMYELNVKNEWKNSKEIGMYQLMDKLIR